MTVGNLVKAIVLMAKVKHTCFFSILCLVTLPPKIIGHILFKFSGIPWSKYNLNSSQLAWKCANGCFSADVNVNSGPMLQMCKNQLALLYLVTVYILFVYIFLQILDFQSDHLQFLPLYPGILKGRWRWLLSVLWGWSPQPFSYLSISSSMEPQISIIRVRGLLHGTYHLIG